MKSALIKMKAFLKNRKFLISLIVVAVLLPAVLLTIQVISQSRNTPYMDQWELVTDFRKIDEGSFGLDDVWSQHNEHRLVFPESIMIAMAYITHWNVRVEMLVSIVLALGMLGMLILILQSIKQVRAYKWINILVLLITSVFIFSFTQAENWLWGWQIQWFLACFAFLVMLWALNREDLTTKYLVFAIFAAFVSTYSLGNGQFAWLIGGLILYIRNKRLRYWLAATVASLAAYHINLKRTGLETPVTDLLLHPVRPILYFFVYIGRPISENIYLACIAGFLGLVIFLACISFVYLSQKGNFRERSKILIVPVSFALFTLLSAVITTVSRSSLGTGQATASRYTTVSNFFWLGLLVSFVIAAGFVKFKRKYHQELVVSNVLCILLAIAIVASSSSHVLFSRQTLLMKTIQYCTNGANPTDDCLRATYPHPDMVRDRVEYLKQRGWAGYSEARQTD